MKDQSDVLDDYVRRLRNLVDDEKSLLLANGQRVEIPELVLTFKVFFMTTPFTR
jgi:hypothetical protein